MGKGCLTVTKYFLFLFNLIFFLCGVVIMGFGLWLLLDNQSFIVVLSNSTSVKAACYILIGVGAFSMLMGFLGCLGAIYEIRCLLGLYFTCLLLIVIAQVAAGALIYFQKETLNEKIVNGRGPGAEGLLWQKHDHGAGLGLHPKNMECCGWSSRLDWSENEVIANSSHCCFPAPARTSRPPPGTFPTAASVRLRRPTGPYTTR
ncbi:hypothetical protein KUCAC02_002733, partial [Chaenocephalus aceratus]